MTPVDHAPDISRALHAAGLLADFNRAGVLGAADVHVATTLGRLAEEPDERVLLATAFVVRAVRLGAVCIDLDDVRRTVTTDPGDAGETGTPDDDPPVDLEALPWPAAADWYAACRDSRLIAVGPAGSPDRPVRLVDDLLYLDRYWRQEQLVRRELDTRAERELPSVDLDRLHTALDRLFDAEAPDHQRLAAAAAATGWLTVIAGGPGTGKTTTVARLLALLGLVLDRSPRVAMAAPTGKAAARLQEAVATEAADLQARGLPVPGPLTASTLHRLLGWRPGSQSRFRHDRDNRLPFDVVVVDETSMVSLTLMSRLLEAVRPDARLVLVGDPDQLASVEAGAVLGDLVHRPPRSGPDRRSEVLLPTLPTHTLPLAEVHAELRNDVVRLRRTYRFGDSIGHLAAAIRSGRPDDAVAVLQAGTPEVELVRWTDDEAAAALDGLRADVVHAGEALTRAARGDDDREALQQLERHRLLCAHRRGPYGVARWSSAVERWLAAVIDGYAAGGEWYVGRPLLVTANDYDVHLYNGDTGVVVNDGERGPVAAFARGQDTVRLAPARLSNVQTVHAMTVHRSQGSQFDRVSVLLPAVGSRLLTRELLYTAVTRAQSFVRVIGTEEAVRAAVEQPVVRASGLRRRPAG